jgi:hypothetical protein
MKSMHLPCRPHADANCSGLPGATAHRLREETPLGKRVDVRSWIELDGGKKMLETIAVILVILWVLGLASSYTLGGLIHILLVLAIIVVILRVIRGRKPLG